MTDRTPSLDALADRRDEFRRKNAYYYSEIERLTKFFVPENRSVLEIGCSTGDLLAALRPARGVGIDVSPRLVEIARDKHPRLDFRVEDVAALDIDEQFDYVVMSDVMGYLDDVLAGLRSLRRVMRPDSRLVLTFYNYLWQPVLDLARALGRKMPVPQQNWLGRQDIANLLTLADFDVVQSGTATLLPVDLGPVSAVANRLLARAPGFRHLALVQYFVARPTAPSVPAPPLAVTVVVPCKNERGNVADIFARVPEMGTGTECVFVDGNSDDGTVAEIERLLPSRPGSRLVHQGEGRGKGDAVRKGFDVATGDVLMILDADLTVPPEDLPHFYRVLVDGHGELVNGTRLVYPMEGEAMRFLNHLGNKFFSLAFTYILGRPIKDTLCGTKVLTRDSYRRRSGPTSERSTRSATSISCSARPGWG